MKRILFFFQIVLIFSIFSCTSFSGYNTQFINEVKKGNYELAYSTIEDSPKSFYSGFDEVLKMLDLGILAHYSGYDEESIEYLNQAEKLIDENYTKSISQNINSYILNDNFIDYAGEEYEDIYVNLFKCLTFISQEDYESAFVEIRKFDNKLKSLSVKYQDKIEQMKLYAEIDSNSVNKNPQLNFYDSAFARYLSMLLYLYEKDSFSANIDYKYLVSAFKNQPELYNFAIPEQIKEIFNTPKNKVRLNIIAMSGLAPKKIEESVSNVHYGLKIALPVMIKDKSEIKSIKLIVEEKSTNKIFTKQFEKLESITNIAIDTFKQKQNFIYIKSIARSLLKMGTTDLIDDLRDFSGDKQTDTIMEILHVISLIANQVTEVADTRTSRYFPSDIYISGLDLDPGIYDISVCFLSSKGNEIYTEYFYDYSVSENKINLLEAVCLK